MYSQPDNDPRYTPFLFKLTKYLGSAAAVFGMGLHYLLFSVVRSVLITPDSSFASGLCCLAIITMNFCNSLHIDAGDNMASDVYVAVIAELKLMGDRYARESLRFLEWAGSVSVATTCLYQHIFGDGKDEGEEIITFPCSLAFPYV